MNTRRLGKVKQQPLSASEGRVRAATRRRTGASAALGSRTREGDEVTKVIDWFDGKAMLFAKHQELADETEIRALIEGDDD